MSLNLIIIQYHFIVLFEESLLKVKFREDYKNYQAKVGRWFPNNLKILKTSELIKQFHMPVKSEKRTLTAIFSIILALILISSK